MAKTVIITGSSSGIGEACVKFFASKGWNVAATSRSNKKFPNLKRVKSFKLDVSNEAQVDSVFKEIIQEFEGVDVVINNAGYSLKGIFENMSQKEIFDQFNTNVFGLMLVTREAIKYMRPEKNGKIIQVASMGGRLTFPAYSIYHSTKWAVEGFSESLAFELKNLGIKIKIIEPGVIKTNFYTSSQKLPKLRTKKEYDNFINIIDERANGSAKSGNDPIIVAKTIYEAATDNSSKLRYISGSPAPFLLTIKKILPDRIFHRLIEKSFKI